MSFQQNLKLAMAVELGVTVDQIKDVRVVWDNGDRYDPTYPGDNEAPTFKVEVTVATPDGGTYFKELSPEFTFTALLRAVLEVGR